MYCLESKISKQVLLTRKLYCVPSNDDAELIRKLNAVNTSRMPDVLGHFSWAAKDEYSRARGQWSEFANP